METGNMNVIQVCIVKFAALHWHVAKQTVYWAIDHRRLRAAQIEGHWYVAVPDLNELWGNHAPPGGAYMYVQSSMFTKVQKAKLGKKAS